MCDGDQIILFCSSKQEISDVQWLFNGSYTNNFFHNDTLIGYSSAVLVLAYQKRRYSVTVKCKLILKKSNSTYFSNIVVLSGEYNYYKFSFIVNSP